MNTPIPDNEINKELKARLNNLDVNGTSFKFYISRVTSGRHKNYFLVTTQLNQPETTKCGVGWRNSTQIQVITITKRNAGSKKLMNEATEELRLQIEDFSLPGASGLKVNSVTVEIENELEETTGSEVIYRKIVRLTTLIN